MYVREYGKDALDEIPKELDRLLTLHGLDKEGWTYELVDGLGNYGGFTHQNLKKIAINIQYLPTKDRNIQELLLHEVAHALCGHGEHNLEWWDKLIDIGGRGIWIHDDGELTQVRITS